VEVRFLPTALQDLSALDASIIRRVVNRLERLVSNWEHIQPEPLSGELSALYKLRVGYYRVLYLFLPSEKAFLIHQIGHRREIYR
jgi:mRNA interferase RelE/StbE